MELAITKYKETEIGLIPEDWDINKFKNVTNAITCGVAATPTYVSQSVGMPFLSASHVQKGKVIPNNIKYITKDLYNQITKHNKPELGDILYTRVGSGIGEAGVVDFKLDFAIYVSLTLIKPKKILHNYFLKGLLNSNYYKLLAKNGQFAGGGVQNLNVDVIREFPIPIPPYEEQKAIATVLSNIDELINNLDKLITKKKDIKNGAMQRLLAPKKNWKELNLGKSATLKARIGWQGLTTDEYMKTGDYSLVTGTDFLNGFIDWDNCVFVDEERYIQDKNIQLKKDDVLVTKDGTIGKVALVNRLNKPTTLNSGVFVIRPINNSYDPQFFYYILMSRYFKDFLKRLTAGSTISHLYQKDFVHFNFNIPPTIDEQKAIAEILSDMDSEIEGLESKKVKFQNIKQGMMQELLTGKTRLV